MSAIKRSVYPVIQVKSLGEGVLSLAGEAPDPILLIPVKEGKMKYVKWLWLLVLIPMLSGCGDQANTAGNTTTRAYDITNHVEGGSTLYIYMPLVVDAITSEEVTQTPTTTQTDETDVPVSLAAQGATASTSGEKSEQHVEKPVSDYNPVITPAPVVVPPVVTPEPAPVPLPVPPDEVVPPEETPDPDDPTTPPLPTPEPANLIERGEYRGITEGRPYFNFTKEMKDYPKTFWLVMGQCYTSLIENDGERWQTPDSQYVVKQSYKGGWDTAVIGASSCKSSTAHFYKEEPNE